MPGMLLFGRRWMVGSDDLVFPFVVALNIRLLWLGAISVILALHQTLQPEHPFLRGQFQSCAFKIDVYLVGYIILLAGTSLFDTVIVFISSRGTIFKEEKRRMMPALIYGRLAAYVFELLWLGVGIYLIYILHGDCKTNTDRFVSEGLVIGNLIFMLGVLVSIYFSFDTAGHLWYEKESLAMSRHQSYGSIEIGDMIRNKYEKSWEKSCKSLFCCSKVESSTENVFGFIARQLADYFIDQLNLVPSDIVAGLILLRRHQQIEEAHCIQNELDTAQRSPVEKANRKKGGNFKTVLRHQRTINSKPFDFKSSQGQRSILTDIVHFSSHTMAIYGWPGYLYRLNACSFGCCRLCCKLRCLPCGVNSDILEGLRGDNCCHCNLAATKLSLELKETEFVYVSYHDEVFEPPFFVAVDHDRKAIVISCRGTMSLKDVLTDLMIEEERIPVEGGDPSWKAHSGMLQSAKYVLDHLLSKNLISGAFSWDEKKGTNTYRLTLVGHSLGAGVASILAFLLRPSYPDLVCYAYSPPGITFNYSAAKYAEDFIYSVVIGKDVIPRLNMYTLNELKFKIVHLIKGTELPKWKILQGCLCQCMLCCYSTKSSHKDYLDHELPDIPPYSSDVYRPSFVGGKVIHIVKTKSLYPRYIGKKRAHHEVVWTDPEDLQTILISTLMWKDHLPDTVYNTLHKLIRTNLPESTETDDSAVPLSADFDTDYIVEIPNTTTVLQPTDELVQVEHFSEQPSPTPSMIENESASLRQPSRYVSVGVEDSEPRVLVSPVSDSSELLDENI